MSARALTTEELREIQELVRVCSVEKFKAIEIANNTAFIPPRPINIIGKILKWFGMNYSEGQYLAKQHEAVAAILENAKNQHIMKKLNELGYSSGQKVSLNPITGEIKNEKQDD